MAPKGMISNSQWTKVMEEKHELPGASWPDLLPPLVPKGARQKEEGYIDWRIKARGDGYISRYSESLSKPTNAHDCVQLSGS